MVFFSFLCLLISCDKDLPGIEVVDETNGVKEFVKKHDNDQIAVQGFLRDDLAFGKWTEWYPSGAKKSYVLFC